MRPEEIDVLPYYDDPGSDSFNYDKYRQDVVHACLMLLRERIASSVKRYPDDSHGEVYVNHGLRSALKRIDYALDAPCDFRSTTYGEWCELHHCPVSDAYPKQDERCGGYDYVRDQVLVG